MTTAEQAAVFLQRHPETDAITAGIAAMIADGLVSYDPETDEVIDITPAGTA